MAAGYLACALCQPPQCADTLRRQAALHGYEAQVIAQGEHYDYLARITRRLAPTPPPSSPRA